MQNNMVSYRNDQIEKIKKLILNYSKDTDIKILHINKLKSIDTISILVRAYNSEKYIRDALESIIKVPIPGYELEILICYDRESTDNTLAIITEFIEKIYDMGIAIKIIFTGHLFMFRAQEILLRNAEGSYITLLDSDNLLYTDKLKNKIEYMKKHGMHFAFSIPELIDDTGKKINRSFTHVPKQYKLFKNLVGGNYVDSNTILFDKYFNNSVLIKSLDLIKDKYFDMLFDDYLIALLASITDSMNFFGEITCGYRIHSSNSTSVDDAYISDKSQIFISHAFSYERRYKTFTALIYINSILHFTDKLTISYLTYLEENNFKEYQISVGINSNSGSLYKNIIRIALRYFTVVIKGAIKRSVTKRKG
ncbi:MAG: glycosyltransferase [Candidatus Thermoplasmatota archaeon]|nr:glycosyltransferase [Candidatus Thermoplasmatota archaeon]MCL5962928.1 glycosyltransferase [Candidatus Thermoplasmatota archaeon]